MTMTSAHEDGSPPPTRLRTHTRPSESMIRWARSTPSLDGSPPPRTRDQTPTAHLPRQKLIFSSTLLPLSASAHA
jgi:hypothetical protein